MASAPKKPEEVIKRFLREQNRFLKRYGPRLKNPPKPQKILDIHLTRNEAVVLTSGLGQGRHRRYHLRNPRNRGWTITAIELECSLCSGTGVLPIDQVCNLCRGTGWTVA